jgi:hypothetical protein
MYYIRYLDMFLAIVLQSALNRCTARPLTESDITDAVKYNFGPPEDEHVVM